MPLRGTFSEILQGQLIRYPRMEPRDCVKLAYQNALGPAHAALDRDAADFSPLTDTEPVWVDQVKQIARVTVDEQGVEAAAVTLMAEAGEGPPPEDPTICVMDLDRPFLFLIRTGDTVLFVGAVENPG